MSSGCVVGQQEVTRSSLPAIRPQSEYSVVRSALESSQYDTFPMLIATYPNDERRIMAESVPRPLGEVLEHYAVRRFSWRLLPFLFFLYLIASIDRSNVAFAALQMNHDLGFSASAYGFGAGIFFVGYCLLRDSKQPNLGAGRCPAMDFADHDFIGDNRLCDDAHPWSSEFLHAAILARSCRGGVLIGGLPAIDQ